jgi:uncharacterized protein YtpQ (UPF0354 family)
MFWKKKQKFTDRAIAYLKSTAPDVSGLDAELPSEATPIVTSYSDDLCICYVVECGEHHEYVQERHLRQDGIDRDELQRLGVRNLMALVVERNARVQPYEGVFAFFMGGDFEASVILLDDMWDGQFRKFVAGEYAAAIPARDMLAFCDSRSEDGIAELQRIIERIEPTGDHLLTRTIYVRRGAKWQPRTV